MTRNEKIKFVTLRSIGNFLVLFALFGVIATFGPAVTTEATYRVAQARGIEYSVEDLRQLTPGQESEVADPGEDEGPTFGSVLAGPKEQILTAKDTDFSIVIPKIGASAKIIPNVDPTKETEFIPALQDGIAHAKGTVFPGMDGKVYLFAHSTDSWWNVGRYNAIFYLLKDLEPGDDIVVFFEGRRYNYVVKEKKIADPSDVSFFRESQVGPQQLVLQTCWPPGTTWKRLFVIADLKSDTPN